jgi:hypothetical protein
VPPVNYDQATQDRINALNVEKANTRVAEQRADTAAAEASISPLGCWPNTSVVPTVPAR